MRVEGEYGLYWEVKLTPFPLGCDGITSAPHAKERVIKIAKNMPPERLINTICHEVLHACAWNLDEEAVEHYGEVVARLIFEVFEERGLSQEDLIWHLRRRP